MKTIEILHTGTTDVYKIAEEKHSQYTQFEVFCLNPGVTPKHVNAIYIQRCDGVRVMLHAHEAKKLKVLLEELVSKDPAEYQI